MNLLGMREAGLGVALVVGLDFLVGRRVLGGQQQRFVMDVNQLDALGLAELLRVLAVVVGDLSFGRRDLGGEIAVRYFDVAQSDPFVAKIVGVARLVVAHLHAAVDHVAQRVGDHAVALAVFVLSRQQIVVAQHVLVSIEVELAIALKSRLLGDFILQRLVADADAEMARLFADQLLLDQPVHCFLAKVDALEHGLRAGAVHLLHGLADLGGFAIDLVAKYLPAINGRDGMDGGE